MSSGWYAYGTMPKRKPAAQTGRKRVRNPSQLAPCPPSDGLSVADLVTLAGYACGAAWALGGPAWLGVASIVADEVDSHVAKHAKCEAVMSKKLDTAVDFAMTSLALQHMKAPTVAFPLVLATQTAMKTNNWELPVGSVRSYTMLAAILKQLGAAR